MEALWKYEHALYLARAFPELKDDAASVHCNIAAVCLKLGTTGRVDLLDASRIPTSIILWFVYTQQNCTEAIDFNPPRSTLAKVQHVLTYH